MQLIRRAVCAATIAAMHFPPNVSSAGPMDLSDASDGSSADRIHGAKDAPDVCWRLLSAY